jgi:hypothetical protein
VKRIAHAEKIATRQHRIYAKRPLRTSSMISEILPTSSTSEVMTLLPSKVRPGHHIRSGAFSNATADNFGAPSESCSRGSCVHRFDHFLLGLITNIALSAMH